MALGALPRAPKKEGLGPPFSHGMWTWLLGTMPSLHRPHYGVGAAVFQVCLGGGYRDVSGGAVEAWAGGGAVAVAGDAEHVACPVGDGIAWGDGAAPGVAVPLTLGLAAARRVVPVMLSMSLAR